MMLHGSIARVGAVRPVEADSFTERADRVISSRGKRPGRRLATVVVATAVSVVVLAMAGHSASRQASVDGAGRAVVEDDQQRARNHPDAIVTPVASAASSSAGSDAVATGGEVLPLALANAERPGDAPAAAVDQAAVDPAQWRFAQVVERARQLAEQPFDTDGLKAPEAARALDYDGYRRIEFRAEAAENFLPGNDRFRVMFDPAGFLFADRVAMNIVRGGQAQPRPYLPADFRFFDLPLDNEAQRSLGFAGFRLLTPLNSEGKYDELVSFRGASFFRALGMKSRYGVSARGLALGTASPDGEEFPLFREFWILAPEPGAARVELAALLDSDSLTGAYRFVIEPGQVTVMQVEAVLFPRREVTGVGIAPLTSMFQFAPHDPDAGREDLRPRVHDSEGLMAWLASGEYVWRPLLNPQRLEVSSLAREVPNGFGLVQRQRRFGDYDDLEAAYHRRPNLWVVPGRDWPAGELVLVEIPTQNEFNDNIVAFWRPTASWQAGQSVTLDYRLEWGNQAPLVLPMANVGQTRVGRSINTGRAGFVIDFRAPAGLFEDGVVAEVTSSQGAVLNPLVVIDPQVGGARLSFELDDSEIQGAELRARLVRAGMPVSETWLYRWRPQP